MRSTAWMPLEREDVRSSSLWWPANFDLVGASAWVLLAKLALPLDAASQGHMAVLQFAGEQQPFSSW